MSFALQVKRDNNNNLLEIASFSIWEKITLTDNTFSISKIETELNFLNSTPPSLTLKKRNLAYKIYQSKLINENHIEKEISLPAKLYFQFQPKISLHLKLSEVKKIEYSLAQNFTKVLTNKIFNNDFTFRKNTDSAFDFYLLSEDNVKLYKKTLQSFAVNPPVNDKKIVYHSIELVDLEGGFYKIDGEEYFYDRFREIKSNHYIAKLSI